ncbi:MAG: dienelactone hydrolase family protein [Anaerolineae bacterium]|nr:dienelactone hydrolase family protein [Anaerolineae bacterium]
MLHGADDSFIAPDHSRRLHAALRAAGVTSVAVEYPGAEHAFDRLLARWSPAALAAIYDVERFLALMR